MLCKIAGILFFIGSVLFSVIATIGEYGYGSAFDL